MHQAYRVPLVPAIVLAMLAIGSCGWTPNPADQTRAADWPEFSAKVREYTDMVNRLENTLPSLPDRAGAAEISAHKKTLAEAIRHARAGAHPGDIFTPELRNRFVALIHSELTGPSGEASREAIREDNPKQPGVTPVKLAVNAAYPDSAPLSTVPPTLLLRLPEIPKTVEYRFVGRALVLRDVRADLIVDYIPDAA